MHSQYHAQLEQLTQNYLEYTEPIESMYDALSLQTLQLSQIQEKYHKLGEPPSSTPQQQQQHNYRAQNTRKQHCKWTQESIRRLVMQFEGEFIKRKVELEEQINLKMGETMSTTVDKYNIGLSLESGLEVLDRVVDLLPQGQLSSLKNNYLSRYQELLKKVNNFQEAEELGHILRKMKKREGAL